MPTVELTQTRQDALRALIALEPIPGTLVPAQSVLRLIVRLVPCDLIGVATVDGEGAVRTFVTHPGGAERRWAEPPGGFPSGLVHQGERPELYRSLPGSGLTDCLLYGFERDDDHVVRLSLHRRRHPFSECDVALLRTVAPALQRLLREQPGAPFPSTLTAQEQRVLSLVASGLSNASIARRMSVAECTVRKHLENAFRKLGVSNRYAAMRAFERLRAAASSVPDQDRTFA
jgi:DNA-binding CsgD family transcriptional regulator